METLPLRLHSTARVAWECCLASTQPRDVHHVPVRVFYVFYLIQASADLNKAGDGFEVQTIKPVCP